MHSNYKEAKEIKFRYKGCFTGQNHDEWYEKITRTSNEFRGRLGLLLGKKEGNWTEEIL